MSKVNTLNFMALALAIAIGASSAYAQTTIEPICRGQVISSGLINSNCASVTSPPRISSYITGGVGAGNLVTRGFFQYTLPAKPFGQKVVAATLRFHTFAVRGGGQTIGFYTVSPSVEFDNPANRPQFSDLGQGSPIASQLYIDADENTTKDIPLNANGWPLSIVHWEQISQSAPRTARRISHT